MSKRRRRDKNKSTSREIEFRNGKLGALGRIKRHAWTAWLVVLAILSGLGWIMVNWDAVDGFPSKLGKSYERFLAWKNDDEGWSGFWSANAEYYVDVEDLNLTDTDLELSLTATGGRLGGTIATKKSCSALPMFEYLMVDGSANSELATLTVWDFVLGKRIVFATLVAKRDGHIMTIGQIAGDARWFPKDARIVKRIENESEIGNSRTPTEQHCYEQHWLFNRKILDEYERQKQPSGSN